MPIVGSSADLRGSGERVQAKREGGIRGGTGDDRPAETRPHEFLVVGIGASEGGPEAFSRLIEHLPSGACLAFIFPEQPNADHPKLATELQSRRSGLAVVEVRDAAVIEPNRIYKVRGAAGVMVSNGAAQVSVTAGGSDGPALVDQFFRSLAASLASRAVGVILSGTSSDGALGVRAIQGAGGFTFAQQEAGAQFGAMPRSAIATGHVDFVLTPEEIGRELARIGRTLNGVGLAKQESAPFDRVVAGLLRTTGYDIGQYSRERVRRCIARRMLISGSTTVEEYAPLLQRGGSEVRALWRELVFRPMRFFGHPALLRTLKAHVFPRITSSRQGGGPIRIWTPGCVTGEETYSVAIALAEYLNGHDQHRSVRIFATDPNREAIERARAGLFTENISAEFRRSAWGVSSPGTRGGC